jgi:hypothetical protein
MKSVLIISISSILAFLSLGTANASEDWYFSVGLNYWRANWETNFDERDINSGEMLGGQLGIFYRKYGFSAYDYEGKFDASKKDFQGRKIELRDMKRSDKDFFLSYMIFDHPSISLGAGYKYFTVEYNDWTFKLNGLLVSGSLYWAFQEFPMFIYGNLIYYPSFNKADISANLVPVETKDETWSGSNAELGFGYITNFNIWIKIAYRYQQIVSDYRKYYNNSGAQSLDDWQAIEVKDTVQGPMLAIIYRF